MTHANLRKFHRLLVNFNNIMFWCVLFAGTISFIGLCLLGVWIFVFDLLPVTLGHATGMFLKAFHESM